VKSELRETMLYSITTTAKTTSLSGTGESQFDGVRKNDKRNHRPTNERGERVVPSDLDSHRLSHRFRGPCCLCPIDPVHNSTFIEAAIYAAPTGRYVGEYIARCAERECDYLGA
jgi:hypothetical protein